MARSRRRRRPLVLSLTALVLALSTGQARAQVLNRAAALCQQAIGRGGQKFKKAKLKAWEKCLDGLLVGRGCDTAARDGVIATVENRFVTYVTDRCSSGSLFGAPPGAAGFATTCDFEPGSSDPVEAQCRAMSVSDAASLTRCLICWKQAELHELLRILYPCLAGSVAPGSDLPCGTPPAACPTDRSSRNCLRLIAKAGTRFFLAKEKAMEQCLDAVNKGKIQGPCPDAKAQQLIATAEAKKAAQIQKCAAAPPWWNVCPEDSSGACLQTIATLGDITRCVDGAAEEIVDEVVCQQYPRAAATGVPCPVETTTTTTTTTSTTSTTNLPLPLDHFKAYNVTGGPLAPQHPVVLTDQFHQEQPSLGQLTFFMPPVSKNSEPIIYDPDHLACYEILTGTFGPLEIEVTNQYGVQRIFVLEPRALCLPTEKNPGPVPRLLIRDHYKCYKAIGQPVNRGANLVDQFETENVAVLEPVLFCNPVEKIFQNQRFPITNAVDHLTCYHIEPPGGPIGPRGIRNQFFDGSIVIDTSFALCVPSQKRIVPCTESSTSGCAGACGTGTTCEAVGNACFCQ